MSNIQVIQFFIDQGQGYLAVKIMAFFLIVIVPSQAIMFMKKICPGIKKLWPILTFF